MSNMQQSHFGSDGYKELEMRDNLNTKRNWSYSCPKKRMSRDQKLLQKMRKQNRKLRGY